MTCRKNADPTVKPGKKSCVSGTKLDFPWSHNAAWESSTGKGLDEAGLFYSHVAKLWIKKYSWHFDHEQDLEEDTPNPTPESLLELEEEVDDTEAIKRAAYYNDMCKVSFSKIVLYEKDSLNIREYTVIITGSTKPYQP